MAAEYCLREAGIDITQVEYVVFYDKPILKFDRLLETYLSYAPMGWKEKKDWKDEFELD